MKLIPLDSFWNNNRIATIETQHPNNHIIWRSFMEMQKIQMIICW